jgi:hypothetical protein
MNMPSHDARREMEQRALRNVRGLVDRIQDDDRLDARRQRRVLLLLLAGVALGLALLLGLYFLRSPDPEKSGVIELPPVGTRGPAR